RHDRGVAYAQALEPTQSQLRIHHSVGIRSHATGAGRVPASARVLAHIPLERTGRMRIDAWLHLPVADGVEGRCVEDLDASFEGCDRQRQVLRFLEVTWIDE